MASWEVLPAGSGKGLDETYSRNYEWTFDGDQYTWDMELPARIYDVHKSRHRVRDYGTYIADELTQQLCDQFYRIIVSEADRNNFSSKETVKFVTRFVQSLPYTPDNVSTGYKNYARYPIETLVDETCDCQGASLLLAAILHSLGYHVALLQFERHLGVCVNIENTPKNIEFDGTEYSYVEATESGWNVGVLPTDLQGQSPVVHRINDSPALYAGWNAMTHGGTLHCEGVVMNKGAGPARNVELLLRLLDQKCEAVDGLHKQWNLIGSGDAIKWTTHASVEADRLLTPQWTLSIKDRIHDWGEAEPQRT